MKQFPYTDLSDAKRHATAIERIAASARVRVEDVRPLYEKVLAEMSEGARIKTYLYIFTARKVEKLLSMGETNRGNGLDISTA